MGGRRGRREEGEEEDGEEKWKGVEGRGAGRAMPSLFVVPSEQCLTSLKSLLFSSLGKCFCKTNSSCLYDQGQEKITVVSSHPYWTISGP